MEVVVLDELIEVDGEEFERDDEVLAEYEVVLDHDDVVSIIRVILLEVLEDLQFHSSLVLELFLVPDELHSDQLVGLVVQTLNGLAEAPFPEELEDLKSETNVVFQDDLVVPSFIVIAIVVGVLGRPLDLL